MQRYPKPSNQNVGKKNERGKSISNGQHLSEALSFYGVRRGSESFFSFLYVFNNHDLSFRIWPKLSGAHSMPLQANTIQTWIKYHKVVMDCNGFKTVESCKP